MRNSDLIRSPSGNDFRLPANSFDRLINSLAANNETVSNKYLALRKNLVRFFEVRGCPTADEAADEVLNRLARNLENGRVIENLNTYALGIARFLASDLRKLSAMQISTEFIDVADVPQDDEQFERERKLNFLQKLLGELPKESRYLIVNYYQGDRREKINNRRKMAKELGISPCSLRNRAARIRRKLGTNLLY